MKSLLIFTSLFLLLSHVSCQKNDEDVFSIFDTFKSQGNEIEIGAYKFQFPKEFKLVNGQGIDSYVGRIISPEITLYFDYGGFTKPEKNLPRNHYVTVEGEVSGHFEQIVQPLDPETDITKIHLYNKHKSQEDPFSYYSLTVSASGLTIEEQDLVLKIFNSVIPTK